MARRPKGPISPGYVRRTSPTACSVMPFTGSSVEEMEQLRYLARTYARAVPYGLDWPLNFWADRIGFDEHDDTARLWLSAYHSRNTDPALIAGSNTRH